MPSRPSAALKVSRPPFNTTVLLDREGKLAGKYRKIHLPREEWREGIVPGHNIPCSRPTSAWWPSRFATTGSFRRPPRPSPCTARRSSSRRPGAPPFPTRKAASRAKPSSASAHATTACTWSPRSMTAAAWSSIRWGRSWSPTEAKRAYFGANSIWRGARNFGGWATGDPSAPATAWLALAWGTPSTCNSILRPLSNTPATCTHLSCGSGCSVCKQVSPTAQRRHPADNPRLYARFHSPLLTM